MKQKVLFFFLAVLWSGCGGDDDNGAFDSINGRWRIVAQEVVAAECPIQVGGFSDIVRISVAGEVVTVTPETISELTFTGSEVPGGILTNAVGGPSCGTSGSTNYSLSIEDIPIATKDSGKARYTYKSICSDGSVACEFTAEGFATHLSEDTQG